MRVALTIASILAVWGFYVAPARAGGLEYTGQGAQSLARGGAVAARAEDPMVLAHNPAGLAELRGTQLMLNVNLALFDACYEPAGYYGWGVYGGGGASELPDPDTGENVPLPLGQIDSTGPMPVPVETEFYTDPMDTVCLDQSLTPVPQIAWTMRVSEKLGIGFGLIFPSVSPSGHWGDKNGVIRNEDGELRPAATRYMMLSSANLGVFPNLGVGYRITDAIRLGVSFEWGIIAVNNFTMATAFGGTEPVNALLAHVKAQDYFVPALTASAHFVPDDALDLVLAFRAQDSLKASGDIDLTTGVFDPAFKRHTTGGIPIKSLVQHMPWKLRAGARYADRIAPRPTGTGHEEGDIANEEPIHDPLQDERWDVELDVEYQMNSRNDKQVLTYETRDLLFVPESTMSMPVPVQFPHPDGPQDTQIEKNWQDQLSFRLGGTFNPLPGLFGISAGAHYETRGVDPDFMQIDQWPVQRVGLHTGVIVRIAKSIDFVLSYAHIFQETIVVAAPPHQANSAIFDCYAPGIMGPMNPTECKAPPGKLASIDKTVGVPLDRMGTGTQVLEERSQGTPDGEARLDQNLNRLSPPDPPYIVNAGTYRSDFDIIAAGVNVHF